MIAALTADADEIDQSKFYLTTLPQVGGRA